MIIPSAIAQTRFAYDFEKDLSGWLLKNERAIRLVPSHDKIHGHVMELRSDGAVYALIKRSDLWGSVRIEGEVCFPENEQNYLGVICNCQSIKSRTDFGSIYIKGDESYIAMNPWRDGNASRLLYEEYRTFLTGKDSIEAGTWKSFKAEIVRNECHFYVGDTVTPKVTFSLFELDSGLVGLNPPRLRNPCLD